MRLLLELKEEMHGLRLQSREPLQWTQPVIRALELAVCHYIIPGPDLYRDWAMQHLYRVGGLEMPILGRLFVCALDSSSGSRRRIRMYSVSMSNGATPVRHMSYPLCSRSSSSSFRYGHNIVSYSHSAAYFGRSRSVSTRGLS